MTTPGEILERAGVPWGGARPTPAILPEASLLRDALQHAASTGNVPIESLLAWLRAFEQHWPAQFQEVVGDGARALMERLETLPVDRNRYLKLRRIAIENLAACL